MFVIRLCHLHVMLFLTYLYVFLFMCLAIQRILGRVSALRSLQLVCYVFPFV